jgi:hypothetical protein
VNRQHPPVVPDGGLPVAALERSLRRTRLALGVVAGVLVLGCAVAAQSPSCCW